MKVSRMERLTMCVDSHLLDNGKLDKEYSLTDKMEFNEFSCMDVPNAIYNKLGELEDVLEKYGIDNLDDFIKEYSSRNIKLANDNYALEQELTDLQHRLKELEEELKNYKLCRCVDCSTEYEKGLETSIDELENENQQLKQSQKQLAVEELKLALENFRNRPTYLDVARQELCLSDQDKQFIDFINNRIKELDGGKNDYN